MSELLHNHSIVRTQILFNVSINKTQVVYACAGQRLGCSWGRIVQVDGDAFALPQALQELKKAESALMPKALEKELD